MEMDPQQPVWIVGATGRIGRALERHLKTKGRCPVFTTGSEVDVSNLEVVNEFAMRNRPTIVINCAGITAKDQEVIDPVEAYKVNALGARNLAIASEAMGAIIVHFSTDDIFLSNGMRSVNEFDDPHPTTVYGKSKLAGERLIRELNPRHLIIRSSWVYTGLPEDRLMLMLECGKRGEPISVAANQIASPTSAARLAQFTVAALENDEFGIFHAACEGTAKRSNFIRRAFDLAGYDPSLVKPIEVEDGYYVGLDNLMLKMTGFFEFPTWEEELERFMKRYNEKQQ